MLKVLFLTLKNIIIVPRLKEHITANDGDSSGSTRARSKGFFTPIRSMFRTLEKISTHNVMKLKG